MIRRNRARLNLEQLEDRLVPTTASFSNGVLTVLGDSHSNNINVSADSNGNLHVTDHNQQVTIKGGPATLSNTTLVVEQAGTGNNNTLATAASLGAIATSFTGNGTGVITYAPGNSGPSTAYGSSSATAINHFISNPGGKDVFHGGAGANLFDWEPGTGTDSYIGAGKFNAVLVVGNTSGSAETDSLTTDSHGDVIFTRQNLVPFTLTTSGIENWFLEPSTGAGNKVTIGDLTGTPTKRVEVDASNSSIWAGNQDNAKVNLVVNGTQNAVREGAGPTMLENTAVPTASSIIAAWLAHGAQ